MSNGEFKTIEGSVLRATLRSKGLPGGGESICCGGRKRFSRDYESQLKALGYTGAYKVKENGIIVAFIKL